MTPDEKRMHGRSMRFRRKLLQIAAELGDDEVATVYREAAAEVKTFADHVRKGIRPAPTAHPSLDLIVKAEEFDAHCELLRFEKGQKAFERKDAT